MVSTRFSLTWGAIVALVLFFTLSAPVSGQDCASIDTLFKFSDDVTPEEFGLKTRLWKMMNLDYNKVSMDELKKIVEVEKKFLNDLSLNEAGKNLLKSPEAACLKQQQAKANHYIELKTKMDRCGQTDGKRGLKGRILQAAQTTPASLVECPNPGTSSLTEVNRLSAEIFMIANFAMKTAFVNDLLDQSLMNGLVTYIDMRARFTDKKIANAEDYVRDFLGNKGNVDPRLKKILIDKASNEIDSLKKQNISPILPRTVVNQLEAIVKDMNVKLAEVEKHITVDKGWVKWGLSDRLLALNSDDPVYSPKAREALNAYKEAWRNAVTDPVGMLLLSPSLQKEVGGMRTEGDIQEKAAYGETDYSFERHKENILTPEKVRHAIEENLSVITDQSKAMRELKSKETSLDKKVDRLVRTNPAAAGMVLLKNPDYSSIACDSFKRIEAKDESDVFWNNAFLWGGIVVGTVVAVPLILSGVGIVAIGAVATITLAGVGVGTGAIQTAYYINEANGRRIEKEQIHGALVSGGADRYSLDEMRKAYDDYNSAVWFATFAGIDTVLDGAFMFSVIRNSVKAKKISEAFGVPVKNLENDSLLLRKFSKSFDEVVKSIEKSPSLKNKIGLLRASFSDAKDADRLLAHLFSVKGEKTTSIIALLDKIEPENFKILASFSDEELSGIAKFINLADDEALLEFVSKINLLKTTSTPKVLAVDIMSMAQKSSASLRESEEAIKLLDDLENVFIVGPASLSKQKFAAMAQESSNALAKAEKNKKNLSRLVERSEAALKKNKTPFAAKKLDELKFKQQMADFDIQEADIKKQITSLEESIANKQDMVRISEKKILSEEPPLKSLYTKYSQTLQTQIKELEIKRGPLETKLAKVSVDKDATVAQKEINDLLKTRDTLRETFLKEARAENLVSANATLEKVWNPKKYVDKIKSLKLETKAVKSMKEIEKNSDDLLKARRRLSVIKGEKVTEETATLPQAAAIQKTLTTAEEIEHARNVIIGDMKYRHVETIKKIKAVDDDLASAIAARKEAYKNITSNRMFLEKDPALKSYVQHEIKTWRKALILSKKIKAQKQWMEMKSAMEESEIALTRIERAVLANPGDIALIEALEKAKRLYKESVAMERLFRKEAAKLGVKAAQNAAYLKAKIALLVAGASGVTWVVDSEIAHWLSPLPEDEYEPVAKEDVFKDEDFMTREEIKTLETQENLTDNLVPQKPELPTDAPNFEDEPSAEDRGDSYSYTLPLNQRGQGLNYQIVLPEKFDKKLLADLLVTEGLIGSKEEVDDYLKKLITPTESGLEAIRLPFPYDYSIATLRQDGQKVGQELGVPSF